jgi:hypothetical protein
MAATRAFPTKAQHTGPIIELAVVIETGESDAHRRILRRWARFNLTCVSTQDGLPVPKDAQQKLPEGHVAQERLL